MADDFITIQFLSPNKPSSISVATPPPWASAQVRCQARIPRRHLRLADIAWYRLVAFQWFDCFWTPGKWHATLWLKNPRSLSTQMIISWFKNKRLHPPKNETNPNNSPQQWLKPFYGQNLISQRLPKSSPGPATVAAPVIRLPVIISASKDASLKHRNKVQACCQWRLRASGETQRDVDF